MSIHEQMHNLRRACDEISECASQLTVELEPIQDVFIDLYPKPLSEMTVTDKIKTAQRILRIGAAFLEDTSEDSPDGNT